MPPPGPSVTTTDILWKMWDAVPTSINEGWAILIAAFLGFIAVAHQTRVGFASLRHEQMAQSIADREARQDQYDKALEAENRSRANATKTLKHALAAELYSGRQVVSSNIPALRAIAHGYKGFGKVVIQHPVNLSSFLPSFDPIVYKGAIEHIGLLGPSLASDVITVYTALMPKTRTFDPVIGTTTDIVALAFEAAADGYQSWITDQHHVFMRLMLPDGAPDIGSLADDRQRREAAKG